MFYSNMFIHRLQNTHCIWITYVHEENKLRKKTSSGFEAGFEVASLNVWFLLWMYEFCLCVWKKLSLFCPLSLFSSLCFSVFNVYVPLWKKTVVSISIVCYVCFMFLQIIIIKKGLLFAGRKMTQEVKAKGDAELLWHCLDFCSFCELHKNSPWKEKIEEERMGPNVKKKRTKCTVI